MKKILCFLSLFLTLAGGFSSFAQDAPPEYGDPNPSYPANAEPPEQDETGWFLGSDMGVLFFVGDSGNFLDPQYYASVFGGYNFKGIIQPMVRLGQAIGGTALFDATTFFFIFEGGLKITPIRSKFRPYFVSTVGYYYLDFNDFGTPVFDGGNFTFTAGGGLEYKFGGSRINIGSEYRGMINDGLDLRGVQVTLGYVFQF